MAFEEQQNNPGCCDVNNGAMYNDMFKREVKEEYTEPRIV